MPPLKEPNFETPTGSKSKSQQLGEEGRTYDNSLVICFTNPYNDATGRVYVDKLAKDVRKASFYVLFSRPNGEFTEKEPFHTLQAAMHRAALILPVELQQRYNINFTLPCNRPILEP